MATRPRSKKKSVQAKLVALDKKIKKEIDLLRNARGGVLCYPLLLNASHIGPRLVDDTYEELRASFSACDGKLDVLVDSP